MNDYLKPREFTRTTKSSEIQDPKFLFCTRLTHCGELTLLLQGTMQLRLFNDYHSVQSEYCNVILLCTIRCMLGKEKYVHNYTVPIQ